MRYSFTLLPILFLAMSLHAENWMKRLPDDTYVAMLSIPGSHDTGTGNGFPGITTSIYGPFGDSYARAQDKSFQEQWDMGVRAFDMRPAVNGSYLNDNHGIMPTKLRFDDALYFLRDKLTENPSEFAIIHVLHASAGDKNASNYGQMLLELLGRDDLKDFLIDFKPTLTVREMRGKMLLISRDAYADKPVGGFFRNWTGQLDWDAQRNGQIEGAAGGTSSLYMQDFAETYREGDLDRKVSAVRQLLDFSTKHKTNSASDIVWVYNFASAYSKTSRLYIPFIIDEEISTSDGYRDNASHTNAAIIDYLNDPSNTAGPTGIILADYVGVNTSNGYNTRGQKLVDAIIAIDAAKHHGELSFLYVKVSIQSKGIGLGIWKAIEALHPEIEVWETCTPYFDRRNIHFYINRLGFHAVEFFNEHHPDPHMPEQFDQEDGLFKFEKCV